MSSTKIRKAVIAAAGFGTRFLPQTKAIPKEMLPLVDKPIIQHIVEELVEAGIEDIVIVTGYHKRSIEDHFDQMSADLRANLKQGGKTELLNATKKISDLANFAYIRQKGPYNTATPVLNAEHLIGNEPFIYTFADDFVLAHPSRFKQLIETHNKHGGSVLTCVKATQDEDYKRYGFVGGQKVKSGLIKIEKIIEKPGSKERAPSDLASVSGYLLEPILFEYLHQDQHKSSEESIFQSCLQHMMNDGAKVYGREISGGKFYDTGNKLEYLKTVVDFALKHPELKTDFQQHLQKLADKGFNFSD